MVKEQCVWVGRIKLNVRDVWLSLVALEVCCFMSVLSSNDPAGFSSQTHIGAVSSDLFLG